MEELFFTREKSQGIKKVYRIAKDGSKINFKSPFVSAPFGIESYNNKPILNIELETDKDNEIYNFYTEILKIDTLIKNITICNYINDESIRDLIKGKQFVSCIRNGMKGYLIRTYVKQGINICSEDKKQTYSFSNVKGKKIMVSLDVGHLWIMNDTYGYILNVNEIII